MARGWESKAVEDQINERQSASRPSAEPAATRLELEQRAKRDGFLLARARILNSLGTTRDERYRAILERALAHLDAQLAESQESRGF